MKKVLLFFMMGAMLSMGAKAQSTFTFNTRAWSTNYWTTLIYDLTTTSLKIFQLDDPEDELMFERIVPGADLTFPVGIQKEVWDTKDIYGPYHRAFSNPFTRPGDFGAGLDASWRTGIFGLYAGAYFKSQEVSFVDFGDLRSFYFQPRAGIILGQKNNIEAGVYYDMAFGAAGSYPGVDKDMIASGWGMDFSLSHHVGDNRFLLISFMLPMHNFFNENYAGGDFKGMKRRVGYIMLTHRIAF